MTTTNTDEHGDTEYLERAARHVGTLYPRTRPKIKRDARGRPSLLLMLGEVQAAFLLREGGRWTGQEQNYSPGTGQREYALEIAITGQPPADADGATAAEYLLTAVGAHMLRHGDFRPGERVELTEGVDRHPDFIVPAGRRGTLLEINEETETAVMLLDEHQEGAEEWQNCLLWEQELFYRLPLDVLRLDEPTGERRFVGMLSCGDREHDYGEPELTDFTWVDNGSFVGYRIGLQNTCRACGNVFHGSKGVAKEELGSYRRARFYIRYNGAKTRINWGDGGAPPAPAPAPVGWQIAHRETNDPPEGQATFEVYTTHFVTDWLARAADRTEWRVRAVYPGDIENPTFVEDPPTIQQPSA